ncbi:hypothetical protein BDR04DRAFT_1119275 [Suillus decipiens]|nr:hypothetical protein BDR04DRAFT_1119275 [Suillus decipiens]
MNVSVPNSADGVLKIVNYDKLLKVDGVDQERSLVLGTTERWWKLEPAERGEVQGWALQVPRDFQTVTMVETDDYSVTWFIDCCTALSLTIVIHLQVILQTQRADFSKTQLWTWVANN